MSAVSVLTPKRRVINAVAGALHKIEKLVETGKWCRFVTGCDCAMFRTREQMYEHLQRTVLANAPIDYLEFGVAQGASLKTWLALNGHPDSHFWGFDSFEGLPEDWYGSRPKGTFSCGGQPPEIRDPRLEFRVGLFQNTLRQFLETFRPAHRLVIHNDSDLYSATLYVLIQLDGHAKPGSVVIFDEFWDASHEFRALMDYAAACQRSFKAVAATRFFGQVAILLE